MTPLPLILVSPRWWTGKYGQPCFTAGISSHLSGPKLQRSFSNCEIVVHSDVDWSSNSKCKVSKFGEAGNPEFLFSWDNKPWVTRRQAVNPEELWLRSKLCLSRRTYFYSRVRLFGWVIRETLSCIGPYHEPGALHLRLHLVGITPHSHEGAKAWSG